MRDSTGAVIPNATVAVTDVSTGATRISHTDAAGLYAVPQLLPGTYTLRIDVAGFAPEQRSITLTVGQQGRADATLHVAATSIQVSVAAATSDIEHTSPALSAVTGQTAIEQLPLNGRSTVQLALLSPGVAPNRRVGLDEQGNGLQISVDGLRPNQVAFSLDGTDINDAYNNTPGGASGLLLGVDAVAQFRLLTNGYGAEYGRTSGGVITEVTRAGSTHLHGSAYEFVRDSALDSKNYFDSASRPIPPFLRNQFGGSLGGPLTPHRTFFFGNAEELRQSLGVTNIAIVPNAAARATAVASVQPYLAVLPQPNATVYNDGTGQFRSQSTNTTDESFFVIRIDRQQSANTSALARYLFDNGNVVVPDTLGIAANHNRSRNQYLTAQATHTFARGVVNDARISYNRSYFTLFFDLIHNLDPSLSFVPGQPFGAIAITGLDPIGPSRFGPTVNALNLFQGSDDVSFQAGRHAITAGVNEEQILFPQQAPQSLNGFYQFNSVADFMAAKPFAVELALPGSNPRRDWHQRLDAAYVSDTWRASERLTLTGGIRYERESVPEELNGRQSMLRDVLHDSAATVGPLFRNPGNLDLAPRVGFALSPHRAGSTSIRGAFGVYFDPLWTDFYLNAGSRQPPFYTVGTVTHPVFPHPQITPANFRIGRIDVLQFHPASPYVMQWNTSLQQQMLPGLVLTLAYAGNRGVHDVRLVDENQAIPKIVNGRKFFPVGDPVRNPAFTGIRYKETNGLSSYHSLQATVEYRLSERVRMRGTYIWSKAMDTGSLVTAQGSDNDLPQDPDSLRAEKGLSSFDLRNYFNGFVAANLPSLPRVPGWIGRGWQANGIALLSSGAPFSVLIAYDRARAHFAAGPSPQRPDLVPGRSANPVLGGPEHYFDASAFALPAPGFYGDLPRNTLIGPGLVSLDAALNKTTAFRRGVALQLRAEMFNVLNRPNFAIPSQRDVFNASGRIASAGLITSTLTSARQMQLGAKLEF